jgi:hypothetical protein
LGVALVDHLRTLTVSWSVPVAVLAIPRFVPRWGIAVAGCVATDRWIRVARCVGSPSVAVTRRVATNGPITLAGRVGTARVPFSPLSLCRGYELVQRPTAVPISIALSKDPLPAGLHFGILSTFSHGKELFQHDLLVAVSVVPFEDLGLRRSRLASASNRIAVARCVGSRSVTVPRCVAANRSVAISRVDPVALTTAADLAEFTTQLRHLLLELHDHAIQRRFAFGLRPETTHRLAFSSVTRLGRIATIAIPFATVTGFG